ncbi:MAG: D-2-hydroxyacid dehydrogenase family protein [Nitrospinota bacterium]
MKIVILEDYQDAVRSLDCFRLLDGHEVTIHNDNVTDPEELGGRLQGAEGLVLIRERTRVDEALLERAPSLRIISQTARGVAHIDLDSCTRRGVLVAAEGGRSEPTAELTWALILAVARHIPQEDKRIREGKWQTTLGAGLSGKTLAILGFGRIGTRVGRVGRAFGMKLLAWGPTLTPDRAAAGGAEFADGLDDLFRRGDVVSIHLRFVPATRGLVTKKQLSLMKPTAVLVNTARGPIVDEAALIETLRERRIAGAGLDVYDQEPLPKGHPLTQLDNAVLTPHLGYVTRENYESYFGLAFQNIVNYARGNPTSILNPEARRS